MRVPIAGLPMFRKSCLALAACIALVAAPAARAAPGDVDLAFGTLGMAGTFTTGLPLITQGVAWQGDKLLVVSTPRRIDLMAWEGQGQYEYRIVVTRFNADGTPDGGFGVGGEVILKNASSADGMPPGTTVRIAWQPDGDVPAIHVVSGPIFTLANSAHEMHYAVLTFVGTGLLFALYTWCATRFRSRVALLAIAAAHAGLAAWGIATAAQQS